MGRLIKDEKWLGSAEGATPKPWKLGPDFDELEHAWRMDMDNQPGPSRYFREQGYFKIGDVIHDSEGVVRIVEIFSFYRDYHSDFIPKFKVQRITAKGQWAKVWHYTFPGFIQRAYAVAGDPRAMKATGAKPKAVQDA